jgi:diamine N-acetyltransferase
MAIRKDQETMNLLLAGPAQKEKPSFDSWLERRLASQFFRVIEIEGRTGGYVQIEDIHQTSKFGFVGIALSPKFRGRGLGRSAMQRIELEAGQMALRKLILHVMSRNVPAIRLYESLNYRHVGTLIQHYWDGHAYQDVSIYEKIIREPQDR